MRIDALSVTNFRNIKSALIRPSGGVNVFFGDNGSGKTNLIEAVFAVCLGRSQRGARDINMVGEGEDDFFRLEGTGQAESGIVEGRDIKLTCAFQKGGRKKITINGNPARISKLFQIFSLISMAPEDTALFIGSPSVRRRFMDLHLSQASAGYLADLTDYNKSLAQKNAYLKNNPGSECPFDPLLVEYGSRLTIARQSFVHFLQALSPGYYQQISNGTQTNSPPEFSFNYKPNVPFETKAEVEQNFQQKLSASRRKEEILETAVVGPHRDDLDFFIGNFPARGYGSQGELRSAAVAVMMGAANFLESRREEKPILLLDEIFAELDNRRRENLASLFESFEQIFLTTAVAPPAVLMDKATVFDVAHGVVTQR